MNQSNYDEQNRVKASFYAAYTALTPHRYLHNMTAVDYRMADYMNPFLTAVVDASVSSPPAAPCPDLGPGVLLWRVRSTAQDGLLVSGVGEVFPVRDEFGILVVRHRV